MNPPRPNVARTAARVLAVAFALGVLGWLVLRAQHASATDPTDARATDTVRRTRKTVIVPHSESKSLVLPMDQPAQRQQAAPTLTPAGRKP